MKRSAVIAMALLAAAPLYAQDTLKQDLRKGDYREIKTENELPKLRYEFNADSPFFFTE